MHERAHIDLDGKTHLLLREASELRCSCFPVSYTLSNYSLEEQNRS